MADMALSLTKKAVEGTVSKVLAAIDEDTKLKSAGKQDLRFIVDELQMMQSFLQMVNDNKKRTSSEVVKMWVRQLRGLAFDVEDCVEFATHLDSTWWTWVWRALPWLPKPTRVGNLFQAFDWLKELKARVNEVSERNTRYNLLGGDDSGSSSSTTPPTVPSKQLEAAAFPSTVDILRDLWEASAKQSSSDKRNLQYLVTQGRSKERRVISVWRSTGVDLEAAHILNAAYSDPQICEEFKARARVKLMHPFSIQEFLTSMLHQLYVTTLQQDTLSVELLRANGHSVIQSKLRQLLRQHKYLIILEDVSSAVEWDLIRFYLPDLHNGSRIVISTEHLGFALRFMGESYRVFQLALIPNDGYIYAFETKPFFGMGMTRLVRQLARHRVISLWGDKNGDTSSVVGDVHEAINNRNAKFEGLSFKNSMWINVPSPFSLDGFCQCLPCYEDSRYRDDPRRYFAEYWRDEVRKSRYLVVIEGLQSIKDWDEIKAAGLVPEDTKSCIVVIANDEAVAKHCRDDSWRKMTDDELEKANNAAIIGPLIPHKLPNITKTVLVRQLGQRRVISLWGNEDGGTSSLVGEVYKAIMDGGSARYFFQRREIAKFKGVNFDGWWWVNVPNPFTLEGFCRYLPGYVTIGYENRYDPKSYFAVQWGNIMRQSRIIVVINGLQSKKDWDLLKGEGLVPEDTKSCIVVIANDEAVAKYIADEDNSCRNMDDEELKEAKDAAIIGPFLKGHDDRFRSHDCSRRIEEAFDFWRFITVDQYKLIRKMMISSYTRNYDVHAVWGATGVGKSALLRFVYHTLMGYSLKMIKHDDLPNGEEELRLRGENDLASFERFGWVDVPEPFDLAEFSRRLLLDFNSYDPGELEKTAVDVIQGLNPIQRCHETILKQKCLVVMDGLRSTRDWDSIKQAFWCHRHPESCIFVISIEESIARHCANIATKDDDEIDDVIHHVTGLDDISSLRLFKQIVAHQNEWEKWAKIGLERSGEQKSKHANHIVPKCGRLPKIIDAVAKSDLSFWENINDDLVTKLKSDPQFDHLRGVLSWMQSYFDGCPDSVKPCVFYLSVFATNYKIRKAHLLRRWITEGYSRDTVGGSAKENAERLFVELVKLGIIQEQPGTPLCQISGFFREYIISQPMEDNLVFELEGHCKPNSQGTVHHLTIMQNWKREQKNVFESIDVSRLRSLTVYGKWQSFFISDNKMKRIRVLDLEGTSGLEDDELKRIFGILLSLKFISLRGCKSIKFLPKTVGGLSQLESLDVRGTSIVTLPQAITKLKKIQYIRAGMFLPFEDWTPAAPESEDDSVDAVGSQPSGTTSTPEAEGSDGGVVATSLPQATISQDKEDGAGQKKLVGRMRIRSWFDDNNTINGGVEVPKGIEHMPALHTLGTVNIKSAGGKDFLTKLMKCKKNLTQKKASGGKDFLTTLPQLLKLSVCGINNENWKDLRGVLSAHDHLESLSLGLDEDFTEDWRFDKPKALKSLKLYGNIHGLSAWPWIKDLKKFDLEMIISGQNDMHRLVESSESPCEWIRRLCIKLTQEVSKLTFKTAYVNVKVLKIDCRSRLEVDFEEESIADCVNVLIIHCYKGSEFRVSSNEESGLKHLRQLDTVWLKAYDEKADYVARLKNQIDKLQREPVFKFEKLNSA